MKQVRFDYFLCVLLVLVQGADKQDAECKSNEKLCPQTNTCAKKKDKCPTSGSVTSEDTIKWEEKVVSATTACRGNKGEANCSVIQTVLEPESNGKSTVDSSFILLPTVKTSSKHMIQVYKLKDFLPQEDGVVYGETEILLAKVDPEVGIWSAKSKQDPGNYQDLDGSNVQFKISDVLDNLSFRWKGIPGDALLKVRRWQEKKSDIFTLVQYVKLDGLSLSSSDATFKQTNLNQEFKHVDTLIEIGSGYLQKSAAKARNVQPKPKYEQSIKDQLENFKTSWNLMQKELGVFIKPGLNYNTGWVIHAQLTSSGSIVAMSKEGEYIRLTDQIKFELLKEFSGSISFQYQAWNGKDGTAKSVGLINSLTTNVKDGKQQQKPIEKPRLRKNNNIGKYLVSPVPYDASEVQLGQKVEKISAELFKSKSKLGIAVLETGSGVFGRWQYKLQQAYLDFDEQVFQKNISATQWQCNRKEKIFECSYTGGNQEKVSAYLLGPDEFIRFKPWDNQETLWSNDDAMLKTRLLFLAYDLSGTAGVIPGERLLELEFPDCKTCDQFMLSKKAAGFYAPRLGCDHQAGSRKVVDDCRICGGNNKQLDCTKKCSSQSKTQAFINPCGFCVAGSTSVSKAEGLDNCNVCHGNNTCVDCSGKPNGRKKNDICGKCLLPESSNFDNSCKEKIASAEPLFLDLHLLDQEMVIELAGLSSQSSYGFVCSLIQGSDKLVLAEQEDTQWTNNRKRAFIRSIVPNKLKVKKYDINCSIRYGTPDLIVNEAVNVIDFSLYWLEKQLAVETYKLTVQLNSPLPPALRDTPVFCIVNNNTGTKYRIDAKVNGTNVKCQLMKKIADMNIKLTLMLGTSRTSEKMALKQQPLVVQVKPQSPIVKEVRFSNSLMSIFVLFDRNLEVESKSCADILQSSTLEKMGANPKCKFTTNQMVISLGKMPTIRVTDDVLLMPDVFKSGEVSDSFALGYEIDSQQTKPPKKKQIKPVITLKKAVPLKVCDSALVLTVTKCRGDGRRPLRYEWTVSSENVTDELLNFMETKSNSDVSIPANILAQPGKYSFSVSGCNFLGECSEKVVAETDVTKHNQSLSVKIYGIEVPVLASEEIIAYAQATFDSCNKQIELHRNDVKYYWQVNGNYAGNFSLLQIPKFQFEMGETIKIQVTVEYHEQDSGELFVSIDEQILKIEGEPLVISIGGLNRKIGQRNELIIDASKSYDPNLPKTERSKQPLQHKWECAQRFLVGHSEERWELCRIFDEKADNLRLLDEHIQMDIPILKVPKYSLAPGWYRFVDTVTNGVTEASETVHITVFPNDLPEIQIIQFGVQRPNVDDYIKFQATIKSDTTVKISIEFMSEEGSQALQWPSKLAKRSFKKICKQQMENGTYSFFFTIPPKSAKMAWKGLEESTNYVIQVAGETKKQFCDASYKFVTNAPPTNGILMVEKKATDDLFSLEDSIILRAGEGWVDDPEDYPFLYQFGIRTYKKTVMDYEDHWYPISYADEIEIYLPSANSDIKCHRMKRSGYKAMVKVCDRLGACSHAAVVPVRPITSRLRPARMEEENSAKKQATRSLLELVKADLETGYTFGAYQKLKAIKEEWCDDLSFLESVGKKTIDQLIDALLAEINEASETRDIVVQLDESINLIGKKSADDIRTDVIVHVETAIAILVKRLNTNPEESSSKRRKRSASSSFDTEGLTPLDMGMLLRGSEIVIEKNNNYAEYFSVIGKIFKSFCTTLDSSRDPLSVIYSYDNPWAQIQGQVLEMDSEVLDVDVALAKPPDLADSDAAKLRVEAGMQASYSYWPCESGQYCSSLCLGSARVEDVNSMPLKQWFFKGNENMANISRLISELYFVQWTNPLDGSLENAQYPFKLILPIGRTNIEAFQCLTYTDGHWNQTFCKPEPTFIQDQTSVECSCWKSGIIGAFSQPPLPPPAFPPDLALEVSFIVNWTKQNDPSLNEIDSMVVQSANLISVEPTRLVNATFNMAENKFSFIIRPPFKDAQIEMSTIVEALNETIESGGLVLPAYHSYIVVGQVGTLSVNIISRDLNGDGNDRLIKFKLLEVSGTQPNLAETLKRQIEESLGIGYNRIKELTVSEDFEVHFTIIEPRTKKLGQVVKTAEELGIILAERIQFDELELRDENGDPLTIDKTTVEVTEVLRTPVDIPQDMLPFIVGGTVAGIFLIIIVIVIVLVIIKNRGRTDKLTPNSTPSPPGSANGSASSQVTLVRPVRRISITETRHNNYTGGSGSTQLSIETRGSINRSPRRN